MEVTRARGTDKAPAFAAEAGKLWILNFPVRPKISLRVSSLGDVKRVLNAWGLARGEGDEGSRLWEFVGFICMKHGSLLVPRLALS